VITKALLNHRPADTLNVVFLSFLALVAALFSDRINRPGTLILFYACLILLQIIAYILRKRGGVFRWTYDLIFPVIVVLSVFESLEQLVHSINPRDIDPFLIRLDYMLFSGHPTVLLEKFATPLLTDFMQISYSSYYFLPLLLGITLKVQNNDSAFDRSLFLLILCFYLSYVGYMLMPALGPRYTLNHLQDIELQGLLVAQPIEDLLNRLEGIKRDAFPSGHTGVALTVLYLAYRFKKKLFWIFLPLVLSLIISTVYCRYHYVVDIIAGILLACLTIYIGEGLYEYREKRVNSAR
jgi:membrane-associated phospholipid phosphatase